MQKALIAVLVVLAAVAPVAGAQQQALPKIGPIPPGGVGQALGSALTAGRAVILGVVEGVTEFLPVSSTGHLTVVERLLGIGRDPADKRAADAYAICIQGGAILAVFVVSWRRIRAMLRGIVGRDRDGLRLLVRLALAFVPAAVIGLLLEERIRSRLFGVWPVVAAWIVGGIAILGLTRWQATGMAPRAAPGDDHRQGSTAGRGAPLEALGWQSALAIGAAQAIALWPGVSRSLVTILAGMLAGLSVPAAVEFSFLLGLVTLGAATGYEAVRSGAEIVAAFGWVTPLLGFVVAAVTAFLAVRWMVGWLRTRSLEVFGWYRIGIGVLVAFLAFWHLV